MEKILFEQLQETLFHETLNNGLKVYLLPKSGFNKTYATFTTNYGSIDNAFIPPNENAEIRVPDGIAHFLEHKLFEKEDGDVFQQFSKQGASANAFTSFTRTAYLFSSTTNLEKNLVTLLDMVQEPYFTEKTVEKEKGIIGQEIRMYEDNPDWRVYFGTIAGMYTKHPVKIDIAGTVESIAEITKDLLYSCYETFYHPNNMLLFVVGPIDPKEILQLIKENQAKKQFPDIEPVKRAVVNEPDGVSKKENVIPLNVQTPKCMMGFKEKNPQRVGEERLKYELSVNILLDLIFGQSTKNYEEMYNEGIIDQTFSYDYTEEYGFGFSLIGGDTKDPDKMKEKVLSYIKQYKENPLEEDALERIRKKKIGSFLRALNSPEYIANQFTRYQFGEMNLFEVVPTYEKITKADLEQVLNQHFDENRFTVCKVVPK
jgi:predicted Zn-dependent peptidase